MDSSAEPGASIGTSKLLWSENGAFLPNSGPIFGLRQRKSCCPESPRPSTSAFADIKRMIDEPEWEAFHKDLSSSDFERIRVPKQEPEAFSDENNFLTCGGGTKNVEKRRENSLSDHSYSSSRERRRKRVITEYEQYLESCERKKDRDSEIQALTPIGLNLRKCFVKIERLDPNSYSNAVCLASSDVRKRIKQDPELSSVLEYPVPTLDSENQSHVALNDNCGRGIIESVQDSVLNYRASSIVSEKLSFQRESEPLVDCPVRVDHALVSSSEETKCTPVEWMENGPVPLSNVQVKFAKVDSFPKDSFPSTSSDQDGTWTCGSVAMDPIPESNAENILGAWSPLTKSIAEASSNVQNNVVGCNPSANVSLPSNIQHNLIFVIPMMPVQVQIGSNPMVEGVIIPKVACATPIVNPGMNDLPSNVSSTKGSVTAPVPRQILPLLTTNHVWQDPVSASKQGESAIVKDVALADNAKCSVLNYPVTLIPALNTESFELTTGTEASKCSVPASSLEQEDIILVNSAMENRTSRTKLLRKILPRNLPAADVPVADSVGGKNTLQGKPHPVQNTPNESKDLASAPVLSPVLYSTKDLLSTKRKPKARLRKSTLSYEFDKCTDLISEASCRKLSEETVKDVKLKAWKSILSFDPDKWTDEAEEVDEEVEKVVKWKRLKTDEQLLKEIVDTVKSMLVFKPFRGTELETLAPEVVKHWKTKGLSTCGVKSAISSYVTQEPKYLQMLKAYVHDGIDQDAIRSLPVVFQYKSERFYVRIKCPVCCKVLTKSLFQQHMNNHTNRRPCKCDKCGRGFTSEQALNTHKRASVRCQPHVTHI